MSEAKPWLALGILGSYFALIIFLFVLVVSDIRKRQPKASSAAAASTFSMLSVASLAHTWYYMLSYMVWSFENYENHASIVREGLVSRISAWLEETGLFEEAWFAVCGRAMNWFWSEQLCLFTVGTWTIFLALEGKRYNIKHVWTYMLLGQVVAISVASNLFFVAIALSPTPVRTSRPRFVSPTLWMCVLLSLVTVAASPFTSKQTFLPNLLAMHVLLVLPLLAPTGDAYSIRLKTMYALTAVVSTGIRLRTIYAAVAAVAAGLPSRITSVQTLLGLVEEAWVTLHDHPAQSSIGWDIVWTSLSFLTWICNAPRKPSIPWLVSLLTAVGSIGVGAPVALYESENGEESGAGSKVHSS